jgi:signal transduction histidine kinase
MSRRKNSSRWSRAKAGRGGACPADVPAFGSRYDELGIVTYLGLPIKSRGEVVGVLILNTTVPRAYTPEELAYRTSFADQAVVALEHARLYQQTQEHAMSLEARVQQRRAELAQANCQLQEASRRKSEFLANMSHELRTPLNSILGFAQILMEQTGETLSPKQTRFLTHIYSSGQHLLQLINDILDLSKVEAGKFVLHPERLPVAETLEDILVIARGLANKKGQTIQAEIEPKLPWLHADLVRFKQIFFNLLSNAVKFTPQGGMITVRAFQQAGASRQRAASRRQQAGGGDGGGFSSAGCQLLAASSRHRGDRHRDRDSFRGHEPPLPGVRAT